MLDWGLAKVVEGLPSKHKVLCSNSVSPKAKQTKI
jgi:hypothetical protein